MSNFPYNEPAGCPLEYDQASSLAELVLLWHRRYETSDWSESNDGYAADVKNVALGLMELLADQGAVKRLDTVGEQTWQSIETLGELVLSEKLGGRALNYEMRLTWDSLVELMPHLETVLERRSEEAKVDQALVSIHFSGDQSGYGECVVGLGSQGATTKFSSGEPEVDFAAAVEFATRSARNVTIGASCDRFVQAGNRYGWRPDGRGGNEIYKLSEEDTRCYRRSG